MLIKTADDQSALIAHLENAAKGRGPAAKHAADKVRIRKAGLKGESQSAYLIDFHFAPARNWVVLHDLRLEHSGRVAQIDHVLINRLMEAYVLESKHFRDGVKITDDGEFLRWNGFRKSFEGMPSPLEQNDRHVAVLRDVMADLDLPVRMGVTLSPSFSTLVLVSQNARIDRPKRFNTSRVIKADHLKTCIEKDFEALGLLKLAKVISLETLEQLGHQLAAHHRPFEQSVLVPPVAVPARTVRPAMHDGPACRECKEAQGEIHYGRYGYYFKCAACKANTSIKFECMAGHAPRLRKEGAAFYRECAECGSSDLYHWNAQ